MAKALSLDLGLRVVAAVAEGSSHRAAAARFGVSAASVSHFVFRPQRAEAGKRKCPPNLLHGISDIPPVPRAFHRRTQCPPPRAPPAARFQPVRASQAATFVMSANTGPGVARAPMPS